MSSSNFTFVEWVIVLIIIGLLFAIMVPAIIKGSKWVEGGNEVTLEAKSEVTITNGYEVSLAFEYDDVKVYKFHDGNREYYFSKEVR